MAKKTTRKPNLPQETLERARRELARSGDIPAEPASSGNGAATIEPVKPKRSQTSAPAANVDLSKDYAYVIADLQQMAMLAGAILVALIALSFFI